MGKMLQKILFDYKEKFSLKNKTAFIIGGIGLIGREISTALAHAGARTIVLDVKKNGTVFTDKISNDGYNIQYKYFDCTDTKNLESNYNELIDRFGHHEIFINCSYPRTKDWLKNSFDKINLKSFEKNIDLQLTSYVWFSRLVAEGFIKKKITGNIIQIGSIYGFLGQDLSIYNGTEMKENMTYSVIKGGIMNLTRQMAAYYGKYNIRINTICPGSIEGHVAGGDNKQSRKFINNFSKKTPLRRIGKASEVAPSAIFLASDASSYITGSTLIVDGGWSVI